MTLSPLYPGPSVGSRRRLLVGGAFLVSVCLLLLAFGSALGVRGIYCRHVIATFELCGLHSEPEAQAFLNRFDTLRAVRQAAIARSSITGDRWMARIQFKAADPEAASEQIQSWMQSIESPITVRLVRAAHYPLRIYRPEKGDFVFGTAQPVRAQRR